MKRKPHVFTWKILAWWACTHCGLVRLNNALTQRSIAEGCEWNV